MTDALSAGSIAFTGYSYGSGTAFNFVALSGIEAGQVITFTDNNHYDGQSGTGESVWTWTAGQDIAAGTVVTLENLTAPAFDPSLSPSSNLGTVTAQYGSDTGFDNEVIFAYTGSADNPTYLAAFSSYAFPDIDHILAGTGLQDGFGSVSMGTVGNGAVISAYQGPTSGFSTFDDYKAALFNAANWVSQPRDYSGATDPAHDGTNPDEPLSTAPFTVDPAAQTVGFAPDSRAVSVNEGQPGDSNFLTFAVTRSGPTTGALDFHGVLSFAADSGIDLADFGGTLPAFAGTIPDGASSVQVTIPVSADLHFENDEKFTVRLDTASNAGATVVIGGADTATATIVNDDPIQTVRFADDSQNFEITEGDSGSKTITFTVIREGGGTLGDVGFTVAYDGVTNADDFGGTLPTTFSGIIPDGQSSATFSLQISGDTRYEGNEFFNLTLVSASNDPVGATVAPPYAGGTASVSILNDDVQPTEIGAGEVAEGQIVITGNDHFTLQAGGLLNITADSAFLWTGSNTDALIDNSGTVKGNGLGLTVSNPTGHLTVHNHEGGVIADGLNFSGLRAGGSATIDNDGRLGGGNDYAVQFSGNGGAVTLNNSATGVIATGPGQQGTDTIKNGSNFTINNWGKIISVADGVTEDGTVLYGGDAIDASNGTNNVVHNYAGGLIEGSRHGITGTRGFTAINEAGGTIIGRNGSALNFDNNADPARTLNVINFGALLGLSQGYEDSDGDAIDADGLAFIQNWGSIKGLGANGLHNGEVNISEGIAIGGGTIINYEGGEIYGYGRGIQVDNSSNGDAFAATSIFNAGTIEGGGHGPEGVDPDRVNDIDLRGREAVSLVGNWADAFTNGVTGKIIGGVDMGGGDDAFRNDGTATATGGAAINLGDGNDAFTNYGTITGEVLLGAGNDVAHLITGSSIAGTLDGGDGTDALLLSGSGQSSVAAVKNFETIDVQGGTWLLHDTGGAALVTVENGASLIVLGATNATHVEQGGALYVYGSATGSTVSGQELIAADAVANGSTIGAGGEQIVNSGATANDTTVSGGIQDVWGSADDTVVGNGGYQYVHGAVTDTTVDAGGQQNVYTDGTATGSIVKTGAVQIDWGAAVGTTIDGGIQYVWGSASGTTIVSGMQHVGDGATATGTTIGSGGTEYVHSGGSAHDVTFAGPNATLVLDQSSDLSGTVSGWQFGDVIDFNDIAFDEVGTTFGYAENADHTGGTLTVTDGTHTATLALLGQYTASDFALSSDGHGGTVLTDPTMPAQVQNLLAPAHAA